MTREELKELAKKYVYCLDEEYKKSHNLSDKQIEEIFFAGAEITQINLIEKACDWLYAHLYTRRDEQSPANHFVCSKQEMLTQTEFVEQFKQAMKGGEK